MAETLFIACIFLIFYAYFGYPLSLMLVIRWVGERIVHRDEFTPCTTLIITVHNEAARIRKKLENTLGLEYPREKLQIIVASDGSNDETNDIVRPYEKYGFELIEITQRGGKENAQKVAIGQAKGDILVFTDVATLLDPTALARIVSNFADPSVGSVSSEDRLVGSDGKPYGEGLYVSYEMWLRRLEARANSLVGLSGSFFAARKEVCEDFSAGMQSDFRTVLNTVKMGLRAVVDTQALGVYQDVAREKDEFERKVRTVLRGLTVFFRHLEYLNLKKYGLFSYQLFCHKLLRWLVPVSMVLALGSNFLLVKESTWFLVSLMLQLVFYGLAFCGWKWQASLLGGLTRIPTYFVTVNLAILLAWIKLLKGERILIWTPSERS